MQRLPAPAFAPQPTLAPRTAGRGPRGITNLSPSAQPGPLQTALHLLLHGQGGSSTIGGQQAQSDPVFAGPGLLLGGATQLLHPLRALHQLQGQAQKVAQGKASTPDQLRFLLQGGFGMPRMGVDKTGEPQPTPRGTQAVKAIRDAANRLQHTGPMAYDLTFPPTGGPLVGRPTVVQGYHATDANPGHYIVPEPLNHLTFNKGWFTTHEPTARGFAADKPGGYVVDATLAPKNPLHLKAKADLIDMKDGSFAKIATTADRLARSKGILGSPLDANGLTTQERVDAVRAAATHVVSERTKNPNMTVGDMLKIYSTHIPPHDLDKILTSAGYDAIVNEAQPALRRIDMNDPDGPGQVVEPRYNVRPLNMSQTIHAPREPGQLFRDARDKLTAFETLARNKLETTKKTPGQMSPQQTALLQHLVTQAGKRIALYKGAVDPHVSYHGSQYVFDKFNPWKVNDLGLKGPGFYTTNDREVADSYVDKEKHAAPQVFTRRFLSPEAHQRYLKENPNHVPVEPIKHAPPSSGFSEAGDYVGSFYDKNVAPNVRAQRIITKNPWDVEREATITDKRAILRALRDSFQTGKKADNAAYNAGRRTPPGRGSLRKLLHLGDAVYPPRKSDFAGAPPNFNAAYRLRAARDARRSSSLAQSIVSAQTIDHIDEALRLHLNDYRLANRVIRKAGYDSIRHVGGRVMGDKEHQVTIALRPAQVRHPQELPAAQKVMETAKQALATHQGKGRFKELEDQRAFLRAYAQEAFRIIEGERSFKPPKKQ